MRTALRVAGSSSASGAATRGTISARLLVATAFLALAAGCTPPPPNCCGTLTSIARATDYTATIASTDGGSPTTVKVNVASNGNTTLTFEQGGKTIVQAFTGVAGP